MTEAAIEAELSTACCVTVAGSITPDSSRFSYVPVAAFQPKKAPSRCHGSAVPTGSQALFAPC